MLLIGCQMYKFVMTLSLLKIIESTILYIEVLAICVLVFNDTHNKQIRNSKFYDVSFFELKTLECCKACQVFLYDLYCSFQQVIQLFWL